MTMPLSKENRLLMKSSPKQDVKQRRIYGQFTGDTPVAFVEVGFSKKKNQSLYVPMASGGVTIIINRITKGVPMNESGETTQGPVLSLAPVENVSERLDRVLTQIEDLKTRVEAKMDSVSKDQGASLDAIKELTKQVGELYAAWEKWRKAGKF